MKINGKEMTAPPKERVLVIPRGDDEFVFRVKMVEDFSKFDKICPRPQPKTALIPGGGQKQFLNDPAYIKALDEWSLKRANWMFIESLSATEGLEYSLVDIEDPETYVKFDDELANSGFSIMETTKLLTLIQEVNGLTQDKIDEAINRFLAGQQAQEDNAFFLTDAQSSTPNGVPAKDSQLDLKLLPTVGKK